MTASTVRSTFDAPPTDRTMDCAPSVAPRWLVWLPLLMTCGFFATIAYRPVREEPRLFTSIVAIGCGLLIWQVLLALRARSNGVALRVETEVIRSHYVQALVQSCVYAYWGWHANNVYLEIPLILSQVAFLYVFSALLAWTRGNVWRVGFGPLPIIFSTNLLLWFKPEWYFLQFAMVATGALGKEFVRWNRDGRRVHIFNPSVFGQWLFAVTLIFTDTTRALTLGREIAASFEALPEIYLLLFFLGLVVQSLFSVTLMTLAAAATMALANLAYFGATHTYYFMSVNIGATVFLGMHLLITDPSTSPKSNLGRVIFGAMYGLGYFLFYRLLEDHDVPLFWDKLLPVPFINLCVPLLDRISGAPVLGAIERRWRQALSPQKLNLVHMGVWAALFFTMYQTGFISGDHEGAKIEFWKKAQAEGRYRADKGLVRIVSYWSENGDAAACDAMGMIHLEGKLVEQDAALASMYFERAALLGHYEANKHIVMMYLVRDEVRTPTVLQRAFDEIERQCTTGADGVSYFLLGQAYEFGKGRPTDLARANALYSRGCELGYSRACAAAKQLIESIEKIDAKAGVPALPDQRGGRR